MLRLSHGGLSPRLTVWLLGVSQIIGYGTLYYCLSILAEGIARSLTVPVAWLYGALSVGLLLGGVAAPLIGRSVDRRGAALIMTGGSLLAAVALAAAAVAPTFSAFAVALVASQVLSCLVQYDAAFAALVQLTGGQARLRITHLTLIAGFASTIFWPLTGWMLSIFDWRQILLAYAGLNLLVCLPIHFALARAHRSNTASPPAVETSALEASPLPPRLHNVALVLVSLGFALAGFALSAVLAQMVPLLQAMSFGAASLLVSTLFGPAQVLVRFVNMLLGVKRHPMAATLVALSMLPLAIIALMVSAPSIVGAILFVLLLGSSSGLKSIVQGTLPLALFGSNAYGARLGAMASVRQVLAAAAPFGLSWLSTTTGSVTGLAITATLSFAGLGCMIAIWRMTGWQADTGGSGGRSATFSG